MSRVPIADLDQRFATTPPPVELTWLHQQSLFSNAERRRRPIPTLGPRIIDVGSGLGQVAADWAAGLPNVTQVIGLEADPVAARYAREWTHDFDLPLTFVSGDLYQWAPDAPVTGITCRLVLQHLADVPAALRQFYRWLEPGGVVLIEDIDEGYRVDWPAFPPAWTKATSAFTAYQSHCGGDRQVGRKLGPWLLEVGFQASATVEVGTQTSILTLDDPTLAWMRQRIGALVPAFEAAGLLTASDWADAEASLADWLPRAVYQSGATVLWTARRPLES